MHDREQYKWSVELIDPRPGEVTSKAYEFRTYWSPTKFSALEIAEACAAQTTCETGLRRQTRAEMSFMPGGPAKLLSDYNDPVKPAEEGEPGVDFPVEPILPIVE